MNEKKTDYLLLVNEENRLPEDYAQTVELICVQNVEGKQFQIEKKTYEAFMRLREDLLQNDGLHTELISVYRTVPQQEEIFERRRLQFGLDYARKYVAIPGHSEHHTGLAIDVGIVVNGTLVHEMPDLLKIDNLFPPVHEKLARYGFLLRYPKGKEAVTRINYEPWHFRYIDSPELAEEISAQGLCFEEYHQARRAVRADNASL